MCERIHPTDGYSVLLISNTECTHYQPKHVIDAACSLTDLNIPYVRHEIHPSQGRAPQKLQAFLRRELLQDKRQPVMAVVFGGDGTMHKVLNTAGIYREVMSDNGASPETVFVHYPLGDYNVNREEYGVAPGQIANLFTDGVIKQVNVQHITAETTEKKTVKGLGLIGFGATAWHVHGVEQSRKQGNPPHSRWEKLARCARQSIRMAKPETVTIFDRQKQQLFSGQTILTEVLNGFRMMDITFPYGKKSKQRLVTVAARDKASGILTAIAAVAWSRILPRIRNPLFQVQELPDEIMLCLAEPGMAHVDAEIGLGPPAHTTVLDCVVFMQSEKNQDKSIRFLVPPPHSHAILAP